MGSASGFYTIDNDIIDVYGEQLGAYGIAVYNVIARHADKNGGAFPSYQTIAEKIGASRRKVIQMITLLVDLGLLKKENRLSASGDPTSNLYVLSSPQTNKTLPAGSAQDTPSGAQQALGGAWSAPPSAHDTPQVVHGVHPNNTNKEQDQSNKTNLSEGVDNLVEPAEPAPTPATGFRFVNEDPSCGPKTKTTFDPRQLRNGLWPKDTGQTAYEVYREVFSTIPSNYQIEHMIANVTDLTKWREITQKCALKGFKSYDNVFDVYQNGFRPQKGQSRHDRRSNAPAEQSAPSHARPDLYASFGWSTAPAT